MTTITEHDGSCWVAVEALQAALDTLDASDKDCPIRTSRKFLEICPRCKATANQGCGLWDAGAVTFVASVRGMVG